MISKGSLRYSFHNIFQEDAQLYVKSPGRINIIGEHTDYNKGLVLPAAIDKYIYVAISQRQDRQIKLYSAGYKERFTTNLEADIPPDTPGWVKYIIGVSQIIQSRTGKIQGFNMYIDGDVPLGAGLSSSAALTCAAGFGLNELFNCNLSRLDIAKIGQQTEHEYIGLMCGLMDQFASVMGKKNSAIKLDCKDLSYEYIPIDWSDYEILLLNTNVKHNLASTAYNDRRAACEQGVAWVREHEPAVSSLRDVSITQLDKWVKGKNLDVYTKCRFVIEENQRVQEACKTLQNNDIDKLGKLLFTAHWALSREYEVSCPELDFLIEAAEVFSSNLGARMMGGGFGGCTINILKKGRSEVFLEKIESTYKEKFGFSLTPIRINLGEGTSLIN